MDFGIRGDIERYEADDTQQFTLVATLQVPSTVTFCVFNVDGRTLAPVSIQANSPNVSFTSTGQFFVNRVLPTTPGLYFAEFIAYDAVSRTYPRRFEFEIYKTEAHSFQTYADVLDVMRTGRQIFKQPTITQRDLRPYLEEADAYIDAKLSRIVGVPILPTPNIIRAMSKVFGLAFFYSDLHSVENEEAPPAIVTRKEWYDSLLDAIVAGSASLVTSGGVVTTAEGAVEFVTGGLDGGAAPTYGMRDWTEHNIHEDIVTEERDKDA